MTIDPSTCKPGPYRIYVDKYGVDVDALRLTHGTRVWATQSRLAMSSAAVEFLPDDEVTVIRRADQQLTDWEILRQAARLFNDYHLEYTPVGDNLREVADRLEAEHTAAQEKAAADAAATTRREALIEKAIAAITPYVEFCDDATDAARALDAAGLLAEAADQ